VGKHWGGKKNWENTNSTLPLRADLPLNHFMNRGKRNGSCNRHREEESKVDRGGTISSKSTNKGEGGRQFERNGEIITPA